MKNWAPVKHLWSLTQCEEFIKVKNTEVLADPLTSKDTSCLFVFRFLDVRVEGDVKRNKLMLMNQWKLDGSLFIFQLMC